jgi:poly(3-hydroxybutyrate) depolymerase
MKVAVLLAALCALAPHARAADAKITKESFVFREKKRTYYLCTPDGAGADAPLVVLLHGSGRNGRSLVEHWRELAEREGLVVVGPDSSDPKMWSASADGPDFLRALVEAVRARRPFDARRVYLFGHSAGANYSLMLAYLDPEFYAAAAIHAGALRREQAARLHARA